MQSNIDNWFKTNNEDIRKYFYLCKNDKKYICTWEKKEPIDLKFKKLVKWKNHIIIVCSNFECGTSQNNDDNKNQFIPILK